MESIIAAFISGIFLIIGTWFGYALTRRSVSHNRRINRFWARFIVFLVATVSGIIACVVAYSLIWLVLLRPCATFAPANVIITSPKGNSEVETSILVQGAASCTHDEKVWLLVQENGRPGYYPQNGPIDVSDNGTWVTHVYLGDSKKGVGESFQLHVALADSEGESNLEQYLKSGQKSGKWPIITSLPKGIQLISQINVKRK